MKYIVYRMPEGKPLGTRESQREAIELAGHLMQYDLSERSTTDTYRIERVEEG